MPAMSPEAETVVWLDEVPSQLFFEGERWRVVDMPVRVRVVPEAAYLLTHVPDAPFPGWRFRAKSERSGADRVFEVRESADSGWEVVQAFG